MILLISKVDLMRFYRCLRLDLTILRLGSDQDNYRTKDRTTEAGTTEDGGLSVRGRMTRKQNYRTTDPQRTEEKVFCRWKGWRLCRAEALAYMPILRTNHVVQGFIPANSWTQEKKQLQ
jgi:hypothetical protein